MTKATFQTIYIALLSEGVDVWRPVKATKLSENVFQIISENQNSTDEVWEFGTGDLVRCTQKVFANDEIHLVAIEKL